jgi:hypothetical protein
MNSATPAMIAHAIVPISIARKNGNDLRSARRIQPLQPAVLLNPIRRG